MSSQTQEALEKILTNLLSSLHIDFKLEFVDEGHQIRANLIVSADQELLLVGNAREMLNSIQHYARVALHISFPEDFSHFLVDVNNMRSRREHIIFKIIPQIAKQEVEIEGHTIILVGLSGYERRIIHQELAEVKSVETTSVGTRFNRKMIIRPTSDTGSTGIDNAKIFEIDSLVSRHAL